MAIDMLYPPCDEMIAAFTALAEHTRPACGACRSALTCCSAGNCEQTAVMAKEMFGTDLVAGDGILPFLGPEGCTVAPHLRPLCTVHVCEMHLTDGTPFTEKYYDLREHAGDLMMLHDESKTTRA